MGLLRSKDAAYRRSGKTHNYLSVSLNGKRKLGVTGIEEKDFPINVAWD
ncbi:MAG: hypothetical protein HC888_01960 [Candidatus Competibacteraceae bacterium]|nr:hypothetical protein [Candidatus Competibacteraceae bacterium]